jgi:hypothetical protein
MLNCLAIAQDITVHGTVTDQTNEPLIGVTVMIDVQQTGGAVTDFDGNYSIKVSKNATLKFSYIGYQEQKVPVAGKNTINVKMKEDAELLQEVVDDGIRLVVAVDGMFVGLAAREGATANAMSNSYLCDRLDGNERARILAAMIVGRLHQDGLRREVSEAQIGTYGSKHVAQFGL